MSHTADTLTFGSHLRRLRIAVGSTQEALAIKAGLSLNAVSSIERGARRYPYPDTVRALADALGLAPAERTEFISLASRRVAPARSGSAGRSRRRQPARPGHNDGGSLLGSSRGVGVVATSRDPVADDDRGLAASARRGSRCAWPSRRERNSMAGCDSCRWRW